MQKAKTKKGFTLLEILLVVAAISILAGIVIVAINPTKQLGDTKNAQRRADVATILNAVYQYSIDNNALPGGAAITTTPTEMCKTGVAPATCTTASLIDFSTSLTSNEKYLTSLPVDPKGGINANGNGYLISRTANGRITVSATQAEQGATISATR